MLLMCIIFKSIVLVFSFLIPCSSYKILVVFPVPGISHGILGDGCVRLLLEAGHQVTYITSIPMHDKSHVNLTYINLRPERSFKKFSIDLKHFVYKSDRTSYVKNMYDLNLKSTLRMYGNKDIQKLIYDPNSNFDIVVTEWLFGELPAALAVIFNVPFLWISSIDPHWMILSLIDGATNPALVPNYNAFYIPPFNFIQRVEQLWIQIKTYFCRRQSIADQEREYERLIVPVLKKRKQTVPSFNEIMHNASAVLGLSDVTIGQAMSLPQSYKPIGGYYIESEIEPLPAELQELMDNSKNGVIYFSMGTVLDGSGLPDRLMGELLTVFSKLQQTVIWKSERFISNLPENVRALIWTPQQSILSHPNLILMITHGGYLSMTEAMHFGVPIIGIPILADQHLNVERAVVKGCGKKVELSASLAYDLGSAIRDVISNYSYKEKAREYSTWYHDRLVSPGKELVHWVEHVIRTRGAPHLRSPAIHVSIYQRLYLDLLACIILVIVLIIFTVRKTFYQNKVKIKKN